ncbi:dethiobiotin synthase [Clostridium luticellarii]|uniref:ATP-dependent dethiobiotin synthetase BioD n=1 Tax=Clostridium luticellarii TaxID=1691940 RepID=A0A2T0BMV6_9CLOT|nr:dethiobiotin synthase [Clostridium luticellarii]PRR85183.1 ATP-dependent dethiobiotin synthetase BioD 1 [Clostridium luticellarii]
MTKAVYVVGTDTEIGKTLVTGALVYILCKNGFKAAYFKAALSGAKSIHGGIVPGDTEFVCSIAGIDEKYEDLTPYIYRTAVSPYLASKIENKPIDIKIIQHKFNNLKERYDYIICEGSGGVTCPITDADGRIYTLDNLIKDMDMDVVLVARAGLGTINHTLLTVDYLKNRDISIKGIIINGYKDNMLCRDNIKMIENMTDIPILGIMPFIDTGSGEFMENVKRESERVFNPEKIIDCMKEI